jgi:hypothetical protein
LLSKRVLAFIQLPMLEIRGHNRWVLWGYLVCWCDLVEVAPDDENIIFDGGISLERTINQSMSTALSRRVHEIRPLLPERIIRHSKRISASPLAHLI